ncbi:MAG: hypothetical protein KBE09_02850 [Candidatus Pacebacteria bacterium]|nr:hypothetical protein [Candidatus Paceibacterota bacterium]
MTPPPNIPYKTEWDLTLLYKNPSDPQIEKDIRDVEARYARFEKKYRTAPFTKTSRSLLAALQDYEKLADKASAGKPLRYFWYRKELNSKDDHAESQIRLISERFTKAGNRITFFDLAIGKIRAPQQKKYLADKNLAPYRYLLTRIFKTAKHDLSELEEKVLALTAAPSGGMWVSGVDKAIAARTITWKGTEMPLNEALSAASHKESQQERMDMWKLILERIAEVAEFSESEINALYTKKKITDELRKLPHPYSATILGYENDEKSVRTLIDTVTASFPVAHRFHALKKRLLKLDTLHYADRAAPLVLPATKVEPFPFERSYRLVHEAFLDAGERYAHILDNFLARGQIDVAPKAGKSGGAFCASSHSLPTFVLLNHTNDFNSTMTLAHEMGHAIHSELCAKQPVFYDDYSTAVAETASTFFEGWAFEHIAKTLPKEQRIKLLHDRLQDHVATVFRQIACFNFELELHQSVRKDGWVPKEKIATLMQKHMQAYLGPSVSVTPEDGYTFVNWSHIRNPFYVYSYAYGQLISSALFQLVHTDRKHLSKAAAFMEAGSTDTPENIFKRIGIDVTKASFWKAGIASIERDIDELEALL